ncbi:MULTISPECIES: nucleotide disphospho-sugar-binding domain-containing protein [Nocardia]|uniref:nucleotide disphospho-sugar-binding domain-containing protein n=1 Tax=Nocardia TaxID=1817 RepID=UPI00292FB887|nr:nucleotide disphospho-sugar-binding domain-containing protein [Nocardia canadensis]
MRALLAFTGSRGDAQPGILLARSLIARGHEVTLALAPNLVGFATEHGVPAVPFGCDSAVLLHAQRTDRRFKARNPWSRLRAVLDLQRRGVPDMVADLRELVPGHDAVVAGMAGEEAAAAVAHEAGLPFAAMHFFPIQANAVVPVVPARWAQRLPGVVHRWGWSALAFARAAALAPVLPTGEPPTRVRIQAYDPTLFPGLRDELPGPFTGFPVDVDGARTTPRDSDRHRRPRGAHPEAGPLGPRDDVRCGASTDPALPSSATATASAGFRSRTDAQAAVRRWLAAGSAPVYVGFGSMDVGDPVEFVAMLREVCARRGRRLLLASGWAAITPGIDADVAVVDQVDHTEVLPHCVAVVHHGGAGTTAAALRAGVPQVICSVQADQPYWGRALQRRGLAATTPARTLTGARLDSLLDRISTPEVRRRAADYAAAFTTDGVERAADIVAALAPVAPELIDAPGRLP